jgi:hypothetical protein
MWRMCYSTIVKMNYEDSIDLTLFSRFSLFTLPPSFMQSYTVAEMDNVSAGTAVNTLILDMLLPSVLSAVEAFAHFLL